MGRACESGSAVGHQTDVFGVLVREWSYLRAVAARELGARLGGDHEDVLQEVALRIVAGRVAPRAGDVRAFLSGVVRNVARERRRRDMRRLRLAYRYGDALPPHDGPHGPGIASLAETVKRVRLLIARDCPRAEAEVIRALLFDQLAPSEIAEQLDLAPTTVRTLIHRARRRLRRGLDVR